jgi:transcriptional regulator
MYVPPHFAAGGDAEIGAFVDAVGAADLVTFDGTRPLASLIPVIWDRPEPGAGGHGRLLGHLALANPQWESIAKDTVALAIVHGPQAYVSPSWYPATARHGRVVPTWNYLTVQLTGPVTVHRDPEWLRGVVTRLTARHEETRAQPWAVTDAPADYLNGQLRGIVGIEVAVTTVEGKRKLSQNRSADDQAGVVAGLREEPGPGAAAIADLMAGG